MLARVFSLLVVAALAQSAFAQIPEEISESFGRSGWFQPKSSYASPTTGFSEPGWYRPRGALARNNESRKVGWFTPLATVSGDSSSGINRPGWYLPDRMLSDYQGSTRSRSATALLEGFTLAEARNESKERVSFAKSQGEGFDIEVNESVEFMQKKHSGGISRMGRSITSRPSQKLGRDLRSRRSEESQKKLSISGSRTSPYASRR